MGHGKFTGAFAMGHCCVNRRFFPEKFPSMHLANIDELIKEIETAHDQMDLMKEKAKGPAVNMTKAFQVSLSGGVDGHAMDCARERPRSTWDNPPLIGIESDPLNILDKRLGFLTTGPSDDR